MHKKNGFGKMNNTFKMFLTICIIITISCWERQHHEILPPETPHYAISGVVFDIDDNEALPQVGVSLEALRVLFESDFADTLITTDSLGCFSFSPLVPGEYRIRVYRTDYLVFEKTFLIVLPVKSLFFVQKFSICLKFDEIRCRDTGFRRRIRRFMA